MFQAETEMERGLEQFSDLRRTKDFKREQADQELHVLRNMLVYVLQCTQII